MAATKTQVKAQSTKPKAPAATKKTPKPVTPVVAPVVAPAVETKGQGIGSFCKEQIKAGKTNQEVLVLVKDSFPNASTSYGSIAWYRSAMKKAGQL
jgi:hypothetical protein